MKFLFWIIACCSLLLETTQAQESYARLGLHSAYMPQFTVQEASDDHVRPLGLRLMVSNYDMAPSSLAFTPMQDMEIRHALPSGQALLTCLPNEKLMILKRG